MANNITEVRLLAVPLENDYKHTLHFDGYPAQYNYFTNMVKHSETKFSYQRKDKVIRYPAHFDEISGCNYVMYRNTSGTASTSRWIYAFITKMEYVNDDRTDIYIETDVMQTYMGMYEVKPSFVEREHTNNDAIGENTVPENLEVGEYISKFKMKTSELNDLKLVIGVTAKPDKTKLIGNQYNGVYSGTKYLALTPTRTSTITHLINLYDNGGMSDAINNMFLAPAPLAWYSSTEDDPELYFDEFSKVDDLFIMESESPQSITYQMSKDVGKYPSTSIRNNKLHCFPYRYLLVSNNNGASAVYQYELFTGIDISFKMDMVLTPGCSIRLTPLNYKGQSENNEEGLNLGKFPICNWASDEYTNWLTQNGVNIGINIATGVGQIIAGGVTAIATGGTGAAIGGTQIVAGAQAITNQLTQIHQMSFTAPQSHGNVNCGDVITATHNNNFTFLGMCVKEEYLKIIDNYFDMFGYKCNRVKVPNTNHRSRYWYTKTIDVVIHPYIDMGYTIPLEDLQKIKDVYNNGVTFWRSTEEIGRYPQGNLNLNNIV